MIDRLIIALASINLEAQRILHQDFLVRCEFNTALAFQLHTRTVIYQKFCVFFIFKRLKTLKEHFEVTPIQNNKLLADAN